MNKITLVKRKRLGCVFFFFINQNLSHLVYMHFLIIPLPFLCVNIAWTSGLTHFDLIFHSFFIF